MDSSFWKFKIELIDISNGWMTLHFSQGSRRYEAIISHVLYDFLSELVSSAIWALELETFAQRKIKLYFEPDEGEIFLKKNSKGIELKISRSTYNREESTKVLFECGTDQKTFISQVEEVMRDIGVHFKKDLKSDEWNKPFPLDLLNKLNQAKH